MRLIDCRRHPEVGAKRSASPRNFDIFDFELTDFGLTDQEINAIAALDTETSSFFDHRDPAIVKMLSEAKRPT